MLGTGAATAAGGAALGFAGNGSLVGASSQASKHVANERAKMRVDDFRGGNTGATLLAAGSSINRGCQPAAYFAAGYRAGPRTTAISREHDRERERSRALRRRG